MDYEKIGSLIASLRKEKGLTQMELANKLRVTDRAVSKWERGLGCPDVSLLDDLSRILDISIIEILKGRKLDKDEIIDNKKIIESMNYSKESTKNKIKEVFNKIIVGSIIFISLLLLFFNLKTWYYLNKKYEVNLYTTSIDEQINENKKDIELIKGNQGIYSDEDYQKILQFIDKMESDLKLQNNEYYISKKHYTYKDMLSFAGALRISNYYYDGQSFFNFNSIYDVVHKYQPSILTNILKYYYYNSRLINYSIELNNMLDNAYNYNKSVPDVASIYIYSYIQQQYNRDGILLKDIIKVGEISE